jgi:hypothetical protein
MAWFTLAVGPGMASAATLASSMTFKEVLEDPAVTASPTSTATTFSVVAASPFRPVV